MVMLEGLMSSGHEGLHSPKPEAAQGHRCLILPGRADLQRAHGTCRADLQRAHGICRADLQRAHGIYRADLQRAHGICRADLQREPMGFAGLTSRESPWDLQS